MTEIWKDIPGWEGMYQASNLGHVRSLDRVDNRGHHIKGRLLVPITAVRGGYLCNTFSRSDKKTTYKIHHLVLNAFVGERPTNTECNHKDGIKTNNKLENLEWITRTENMLHAYRQLNRTRTRMLGSKNPASKLVEKDIIEIRRLYKKGHTKTSIAHQFNISRPVIYKIVLGLTWKHVK